MADITISYKGNTIAEVSESGTTTLGTSGKYCEDDISIAYVQPNPSSATDITITYGESTIAEVSASGTTTLGTKGKYCTSNILLEYVRPSIQIITDDSIYLLRQLPYNSNAKTMQKIVGCSFAWNQIAALGNGERNNAYLSYNATTKETTVTPTNYNNNAVGAYNLVLSKNAVVGHKYFESISVNLDHIGTIRFGFSVGMKTFSNISSGHYVNLSNIQNLTSASSLSVYLNANSSGWTDGTYKFKDVQCIDLTRLFGSTIADYIYTLEQGTAGAGVAFFKNLFQKDYYPYDAGSIVSVKTSTHKIVGFNQFDNSTFVSDSYWTENGASTAVGKVRSALIRVLPNTDYYIGYNGTANLWGVYFYDASGNYISRTFAGALTPRIATTPNGCYYAGLNFGSSQVAETACFNISKPTGSPKNGDYVPYVANEYALDPIDLRGILKKDANNNLYYDGDEYTADGTVKRKYEYRAYASGDESLADAITDGTHTVAKLTTPTTETTTGYTARQTCYPNGTEEFVDGRTVEIPVNAVADYEVTS